MISLRANCREATFNSASKMKKNLIKFTALTLTLVLALTLVAQTAVFADNTSNQIATTAKSTSLAVGDKTGDVALTTITFPEDQPNAVISDPWNNVNLISEPQVLSATVSEPVARIKNTTGSTLTIWLEITDWLDSVAASEHYNLATSGAVDINAVTDVLSADGNAASVETSTTIADGVYKDVYLKLTLSSSAGKSGSSTFTVLGES